MGVLDNSGLNFWDLSILGANIVGGRAIRNLEWDLDFSVPGPKCRGRRIRNSGSDHKFDKLPYEP